MGSRKVKASSYQPITCMNWATVFPSFDSTTNEKLVSFYIPHVIYVGNLEVGENAAHVIPVSI